jgi:hypothetical protein
VSTAARQLVFLRGSTVVAVNGSDAEALVEIPDGNYRDALNGDEAIVGGRRVPVPPLWGRVLVPRA